MPDWLGIVALGLVLLLTQVRCQCTFGTTFASTTWHDNTKGTLTFTTTGMTGWTFKSIRTTGQSEINSWQCVNNTDTNLILRTTNTFAFQPINSQTTTNVYAYLCMELAPVTSNSTNSFIYYQRYVQEINLGGERLKVSTSSTLQQDDVCDNTLTVPTTEYHVLLKSGSEASAAIQCPNSLLFVVDFIYYGSDDSSACDGSDDRWDVCTNKSEMAITTSSCTQEIAFSADGNFYCVATLNYNGYDYTTVYNRDTSLTTTTNRFACLSSSGNDISVAPGNCTAFQTPFSAPLAADQSTKVGHRLVVQSVYETCGSGPSSALTPGEIAAVVISVLFIIYIWTMIVICSIIVFLIALVFFQLGIACVAEFTTYGDHIPRIKQPETSLKLDIPDVDKEKLLATLDSVVATSPSHVILNGKANGKFGQEKENSKEKSAVHGKEDKKAPKSFRSPGRKKLD